MFKKFHGNIDSVDYDDLDNYDYNYDFSDDDEYRKIGSIRTLFREFENLSPKEYLNMIKPFFRDLIYEHIPTMELNDNILEESYTDKKASYEPSGWAMFTRFSFNEKENKHNYYRGKDCVEKLCRKLKERTIKIINYEKKGNDTIDL